MFGETASSVDAGFTYLFKNTVFIYVFILYLHTAGGQKEINIIFATIKEYCIATKC